VRELFGNERQQKIAYMTGLSQSKISDLLNENKHKGARYPSAEMVYKIAKAFNVSTDYLLGLTDIKTTANEPRIAYSEGYRDGFKAAKEDIRYTVEEMQRAMKGILGEVEAKLKSQEE
ncbi:MAG: helix-turn-helix transcriptional regulator, partial [Clostridia bacterium]|nr:helix-turn-helix transcriptional regulator [Clostridia bacterium]